jgi:hypothetical protein
VGAPAYDMAKDFPDHAGVVTSPAWIVAVVRLPLQLSFSREDMKSNSEKPEDGVAADKDRPTLVIRQDCLSLGVSNQKDSHLKALQAVFAGSGVNYQDEVLPDDWVLAWMVNSPERADDLEARIRRGEACNGWSDGLKFVGRAMTIAAPTAFAPNGARATQFVLSASGFNETDARLFYDHALAESALTQGAIGQWMYKLGLDIRILFEQGATNGEQLGDNVHVIIPQILDVLIGDGGTRSLNPTGDDYLRAAYGPQTREQAEGKGELAAPFAYLVPKAVGDLLGKKSKTPSKGAGALSYADLLESVVGVQSYSRGGNSNPAVAMYPDLDDSSTTQRRYTGQPLLGSYLPTTPPLLNSSMWEVLRQFLNPAVNEMYTAMRANSDGDVVPTLVVRQIPFTTNAFDFAPGGNTSTSDKKPLKYTRFLDLPRWKVPSSVVQNYEPRRSNVTRTNFVHVFGQTAYNAANFTVTEQMVQPGNQPVRDDLDIARNGLRMYQSTVNCGIGSEVGTAPGDWMRLIADWMIGSHLTLNATLQLRVGVQAPVAEGDNLEVMGVVYHVESVSHTCQQQPGGARSFTTSFELSNGMRDRDVLGNIDDADPSYPQYVGAGVDDQALLTEGNASSEGYPKRVAPLAPPDVD